MQILIILKLWFSFNSELVFKDTESSIRNKLKDLLTKMGGSKFVTTLVLEFKK